jgi:DNA-binding transcriptional ArsR family regulator
LPRPKLSLRSQLSILLLLILRESPAPSHYIAYHLGEDPRKVSTYLSRLRRNGLVTRDKYGLWYLTDMGRKYVLRLEDSFINSKEAVRRALSAFSNLLERQHKSTEIQQKSTETLHLSTLETIKKKVERLLGRKMNTIEASLVTYLYNFSRKTGRKYWWPPEPMPLDLALSEELRRSSGIDVGPGEVSRVLRELEARGIIYITHDRRRGVAKLRLSRALEQP